MNVTELFDLRNKVALITGGAQGLGYEMAEGLAEAGADLVICALEKCEEAATRLLTSGRRILPITMDITSRAEVENAVAQAEKAFGRIDILMNNAGINALHEVAPQSLETWEKIMAVNISGAFLCAAAVGQVMKRQRSGSIVNTGSIYGLLGVDRSLYIDDPDEPFEMPAYTASKGAIVNLTRDLAVNWARYNIRVNCICPATFVTDQNRDIISPETLAKLKKRTPLGRTGTAGDLKGVAVFLASEASRYITGQALAVDGGWTAW
jgi:NAD(P)-dependent dehydrogenase (short-subunit alcohol dehydrogenase family)